MELREQRRQRNRVGRTERHGAAEQLWAAYGGVLDLTVSGRRSPFPAVPEPVERPPGPQATAPWPQGLVASLEPDPTSLRSGGTLRGELVLRATSAAVRFESEQPLQGFLLDTDGRRVNHLAGFVVGTGRQHDLPRGGSSRVRVSAGTDCLDPALVLLVPPGAWQLAVPVPVLARGDDGCDVALLVAGPFPVVLEA